MQLVCAGGGAFDTEEKQLIDTLGLTDRIVYYSIDDFTLYRLYQHALAFVYPSLTKDLVFRFWKPLRLVVRLY